jgi:hypothetical protein
LLSRRGANIAPQSHLERADLLSLLSSGSVCIRDRQRVLVEGPAQVFLDAERLLGLADCALDSWSSAQPTFRRTQLSSARVSLRRGGGDATLELSFSPLTQDASKTRVHRTSVRDFVTLVCDFAEALATQLECYDAEQRLNLRLRNLQRQVERLRVQVQDESEFESQTNPQPETYRRFVPRVRRAVGLWETGPKMRFDVLVWRAVVGRRLARDVVPAANGRRDCLAPRHAACCLRRHPDGSRAHRAGRAAQLSPAERRGGALQARGDAALFA